MESITLKNGETFDLLFNFMDLFEFKNSMREQYQKFNSIVLNGPKDIFDMLFLTYGCYLMNSNNKSLTYEGFKDAYPDELQSLGSLTAVANQIISGRKSKKIETLLQP